LPQQPSPPPPASKKRRFEARNLPPNVADASQLRVLHQVTSLHFVLHHVDLRWHIQGTTTLYVIDESIIASSFAANAAANAGSSGASRQLALHLRSSCKVTGVTVRCLGEEGTGLVKLRSSYQHADPLRHVLTKPPTSYAVEDYVDRPPGEYVFDADSQSTRGAAGMMSGLRVASIASNMGELRLAAEQPRPVEAKDEKKTESDATDAWQRDLLDAIGADEGTAAQELWDGLDERSTGRRAKRIEAIVGQLAKASCAKGGIQAAYKVTVRYTIPLDDSASVHHLAGFHALTAASPSRRSVPPHVYTTAGVYGDHEGPRSWLPCLDSAASNHRASHQCTVRVTAPMKHGLSVFGAGEDFGNSRALLHSAVGLDNSSIDSAKSLLGESHLAMLRDVQMAFQSNSPETHVIPPEETAVTSLDSLQATVIWCSASWTPIPARSLGLAVGPFKILEDPEYFGTGAVEGDMDDDEDEDDELPSIEERHQAFVHAARKNGEGIRQAYFAPVFARKYIHANGDMTLLPDTKILFQSLDAVNKEKVEKLDATVTYATVGVPHRALSLFRDVLALPKFRTASYTQIWIPDAVHGGSTSGALHCCPEVLVNPFLGGAIMDSRSLPPVGSRLPFHQGGRVLQLLQARCAVRGWITAALPLGGCDDVGNGYVHSLIESFVMSLYERGHGAHGEGK